jgi:hypothetical protein
MKKIIACCIFFVDNATPPVVLSTRFKCYGSYVVLVSATFQFDSASQLL